MDDNSLFFNAYGEGPGALVILHGFLGSSANWHTLARTIFAKDRRVLTFDARNHGRSFHDDGFSYPLMADDVVRALDHEGIERATFLGHSMGGKTAMHLALEHPDRTDALVVVDMAPRAYPPHHHTILDALNRVDLSLVTSRQEAEAALEAGVPDQGVRQFLLKNLVAQPGGGYRWAINLPVLTARYAEVTRAVESDRTYDGPVLFVRGERSTYIRDADVPGIEKLFPAAQVVTIPGAGHWVHAEAPQALAGAVVAFMDANVGA